MPTFPWFAAVVVAIAWLSMLSLVLRRNKSNADVWFAVFCGSLAMSLLRPEVLHHSAWLVAVVTVLSCATCNVYWLFARSLFRTRNAVQAQHIAVALLIALLIVLLRWSENQDPTGNHTTTVALGSILSLASGTVLVLAFLEPLRDWAHTSVSERRLRISFMLMFGGCVLVTSIISALAEHHSTWQGARELSIGSAALLMIIFSHIAMQFRRTHPLALQEKVQQETMVTADCAPVATTKTIHSADDQTLAEAILAKLAQGELFREAQLKVADLAQQLNAGEHKISRVITQVLGERNFNQLINRYRIAYASEQLRAWPNRSVIDISADSGFASLGPFNRAFKASMGCTPSEYRSRSHVLNALDTSESLPS